MTLTRTPLSDQVALELVQAAAAAPSMHNIQPWKFRIRTVSEEIQLYADPDRSLPTSDPDGRSLLLGCGAALYNLRLAVSHLGREPVVRLFPHSAMPSLVASVRLAGPRQASAAEEDLHRAIWLRHTNRGPFTQAPIPREAVQDMEEGARVEGAELRFLPEHESARVLELVSEADRLATVDPARRAELLRWTRPAADAEPEPDGVPATAFGPRVAHRSLPLRDFGIGAADAPRTEAAFESDPHLAVLLTRHDSRADWVRAGQALQRVLLVGTMHGLCASFLNQALEWVDLRWLVLPSNAGIGHVDMVLRLGFGDPVPATPRRPLGHVLELSRD